MDLARLLARPGLMPELRHACVATAAIAAADWPRLRATLTAAATAGLPRPVFAETLLQATLFFGFPRTVTAFATMASAWPAAAAAGVTDPGGLPPERRADAGRELFTAIYGANAEPVRGMLASFHPEFHDFVLEAAYGRILTRPELGPRQRELLAVTALAALDQIPQLIAHARGARHFGAGRDEVREALVCALGDGPELAPILARVR